MGLADLFDIAYALDDEVAHREPLQPAPELVGVDEPQGDSQQEPAPLPCQSGRASEVIAGKNPASVPVGGGRRHAG